MNMTIPKQRSLTLHRRERMKKKKKSNKQKTLLATICFTSTVIFLIILFKINSSVDRGDNTDNGTPRSNRNSIEISEELIAHLNSDHMNELAKQYKDEYASAYPFKHIVIDDLFPQSILDALLGEIPESLVGATGCYSDTNKFGKPSICKRNKFITSFQYKKSSIRNEEELGPITREVIHFLNSNLFVSFLNRLTGMFNLIPDHTLEGAGVHLTARGGKLDLHADFNSQTSLNIDRRVNVFLFLNPDWEDEYGGHLELWNKDMTACGARILPSLGRMVIFSTTDFSHHGHPHPLTAPEGRVRRSIAMYYYTVGRPARECLDGICPKYDRDKGETINNHETLWQKPVGCENCMDCFQSNF